MRTVWKYDVPEPNRTIAIQMPACAKFRIMAADGLFPSMWWSVNTDADKSPLYFKAVGTGFCAPDCGTYVGTYFHKEEVWHVYEVPTPI